MDYEDWIKQVAGLKSASTGQLVEPRSMDSEESKKAHEFGQSPQHYLDMIGKRKADLPKQSLSNGTPSLGFWLALIFAVVYVCGGVFGIPYTLFYVPSTSSTETKPPEYSQGIISYTTMVATDIATLDKAQSALSSNNVYELGRIESAGGFFIAERGTVIKILDRGYGSGYFRIELQSGSHSGKTGVVESSKVAAN